jgi:hypothetical protein
MGCTNSKNKPNIKAEVLGVTVGTDGTKFDKAKVLTIGANIGPASAEAGVSYTNGLSIGHKITAGNIHAETEIGATKDDGITAHASAAIFQTFSGGGANLREFFETAKAKGGFAPDIINWLFDNIRPLLTSAASVLDGLDLTFFRIGDNSEITVGAGISEGGTIRVGWEDSEGYYMIGASGEVVAGGMTLFAGFNKNESVKVITSVKVATVGLSLKIYFEKTEFI